MTIELHGSIEEQLRDLAAKQGRDVPAVVEEAVQQYVESSAITDLDAADVGAAQSTLLKEFAAVRDWKADDA